MGHLSSYSVFGSEFWINKLRELGYPLEAVNLDLRTLREQKALACEIEASKVTKLYSDDYLEILLVELDGGNTLRRNVCTEVARLWKENSLVRPLFIFTNGTDSVAVIVPCKGMDGEARVLRLSDRLYSTDVEVLESMRFSGGADSGRKYDTEFFPYERIRDRFFEGYKSLYQRIEKATERDFGIESSSYARMFLARLMFLYFLQKKGWLNNNRRFIETIVNCKELNRLFYESLNKENLCGLPFLNGSLFEKESYMTLRMENRLYPKMDKLFNESREFFNQYNFALDETSPLDIEVSINPALIGSVFENMLSEHERGSRGTFYTPRSESSFICRRALASYLELEDKVSADGKTFHDGLTSYIERLRKAKNEEEVKKFREKLLSLTILDPAVGSGGFLLAMMQEVIDLIQEAEATLEWESNIEFCKKRMLPNLYGFDIEPEAIEIARMRLWLSLIIDQKQPEPLPNLDMNVTVIEDSLIQPAWQRSLSLEVKGLKETFSEVKTKYLNEHRRKNRENLKEQLQKTAEEISKKTGASSNVIEAYMPHFADIVVMNPPYVRQESLSHPKKDYYAKEYALSKKSDIFAYFLVRILTLLNKNGVASVISSDKWLETEYGVSLQKKLKQHLNAIYCQRERTFGADINTVITVYSSQESGSSVNFTYLESYSRNEVRRNFVVSKDELDPGKWYYIRAPRIFLEKVLPRLTCRLGYFANIMRGPTTGANEFFYVKDVGQLYEGDFLNDPKKFEQWCVKAKNAADLEKQGLTYIENEARQRFIVEKEDIIPAIRSPTELDSYIIRKVPLRLFKPACPEKLGRCSMAYVRWGEKQEVQIKKGKKKGESIKGYNDLTTTKSRKPYWFNLIRLEPSHIILNRFVHERHFSSYAETETMASDACALVYPKVTNTISLWLYMNSTIFYLTEELYGMRMGGGSLETLAGEFENFPVFDLERINPDDKIIGLLERTPLRYNKEICDPRRRSLDTFILKAMAYEEPEKMLIDLYSALVEVIEDRIIKGHHESLTVK